MIGPDEPVRVVIADDQQIVREGIATVLGLLPDIEVVGTAGDGHEAVALVDEHRPHVVHMDLGMPRLGGADATRRITDHYPGTRVVVLTTLADDSSIVGALQAGAVGYLTKDAGRDQIARAIHAAAGSTNAQIAGALFVSPSTVKTHINNIFAKTGVTDRGQAIAYAYQHGLADSG